MAVTAKVKRFDKAETDIAVLQVQVQNLDEKIDEIKFDVKELHECLDKNMLETRIFLKEFQEETSKQHEELSEKVSSIEKIKWMLLGAAAVAGATGIEAIQMLLAM
jgi:archaellum component FlaC